MTEPVAGLTAAEVRAVRFGRPPWGRRGYHKGEVEAFLELVAARLQGPSPLTARDVHDVAFSRPPIGRRGYNEDEVDVLLDR
ncbi:MAG TPA: DivIVA domain-containing protein, partial [Mycolicibacillus parakoreensis]|nr:DivIVA domain-containing protein [Mycolicibacillus parakoreensis]